MRAQTYNRAIRNEAPRDLASRRPGPGRRGAGAGARGRAGLIGRGAELELFERLLDGLPESDGGAVCVLGEPGIGKTALIAELRERAHTRGVSVLSARAAEFESGLPFAVVVDAIEQHPSALSSTRLALRADELALLAALFPSLACAGARSHADAAASSQATCKERADPESERQRGADARPQAAEHLLRALRSLLEALARDGPLLLALDDLHWADAASIDLVCRLLHRGLGAPVLLALASRPIQSPPRLLMAVEEAERHGVAQRVELAPLTSEQGEELLGSDLEPALRESLYRESGGNPFYLEQLAAAARRGAGFGAPGQNSAREGVPAGVSGVIGSELNALSERARTVLYAAAVLGEPFDPALLADTAQLAQAQTFEGLEELLARDLIRAGESGARFRFRHPIVQRAVYAAAGPAWTLAAHARVAAALTARGASALARAIHVERSASIADEQAIALLSSAGEQALASAPAAAARWFGAAARLLPQEDSFAERRLELLARRAAALGTAGDIAEMGTTLRAYLRVAPRDGSALRAQAAELIAMLDVLLGQHDDARDLIAAELGGLADGSSPEAAALQRVLAFTHVMDADWTAARRWASLSVQARASGVVKVAALSTLALAEIACGEVSSAEAAMSQAADEYESLTDAQAATQPAAASWLAWAEVCMERYPHAIAHLQRASELSRVAPQRITSMVLLVGQGQALALRGRITELAGVAEELLDAALLSTSPIFLSWAMSLQCVLELRRGDLYAAVHFGERALSAGAQSGSPQTWLARACLAEALLEIGEPHRCREQLITKEDALRLPPFLLYEASYYELLVRAELAIGHRQRAAELAEHAVQLAARLEPLRVPLGHAARAQALVALEQDEPVDAAAQALQSVRAYERAGALMETGRSRLLAGRALAAADRREDAVAALQRAHAQLAERGAYRYRDEAARELRKLGHVARVAPARGTEVPPVSALTPRELQVIERVAVGMTNRQIAEELFLSVRTVDRHAARIFEKLGVSSRAAAASEFERARAAGEQAVGRLGGPSSGRLDG